MGLTSHISTYSTGNLIFSNGACFNVVSASMNVNFDGGISKCSYTFVNNQRNGGTTSFVGMNASSSFSSGNSNPFNFHGKVISEKINKKSGESTTTIEMIDGSYVLDQKNILLFRRAFGVGSKIIKTKKVRRRIVTTNISYAGKSPRSINFVWKDVDLDVACEVYCANGRSIAGAVVIGEEDYSSDPCSVPSSSYSISEALGAIGVNGVSSDLRVSYEGSFRTVLSSICNDLGYRWYWDKGIVLVDSSNASNGVPSPKEGCNIISSSVGSTLEGTFSQGSVVFYQNEKFAQTMNDRQISGYEENIIGYTLPDGVTEGNIIREALYSSCSPLKDYDLIMKKRWEDLGKKVFAKVRFNVYQKQFADYLRAKFGIKENVDIGKALAFALNVSNVNNTDEPFSFEFWVIQEYPEGAKAYNKKLNDAVKYGESALSYLYYPVSMYGSNSIDSSSSYITKKTISIDPEPQFVLKNGKLKRGYFESVEVNSYGETESDGFSNAISKCFNYAGDQLFSAAYEFLLGIGSTNTDGITEGSVITIGVIDTFVATAESVFEVQKRDEYINQEASLEEKERNTLVGAKLSSLNKATSLFGARMCVFTSPDEIKVESSSAEQDKRELTIPLTDKTIEVKGLDGQEFNNPCKNMEDIAFELYEKENSNNGSQQGKSYADKKPNSGRVFDETEKKNEGDPVELKDPSKKIYKISTTTKSSGVTKNSYMFVSIGGLLPYRSFINYEISHSAAMSMGNPNPTFSCSVSSGESVGLERSILISDISNDSFDDNDDTITSSAVTAATSYAGPVKFGSFECTDFSLPINNSLRSISVAYNNGQFRVRYEYMDYPPKPPKIIYRRRIAQQVRSSSSI